MGTGTGMPSSGPNIQGQPSPMMKPPTPAPGGMGGAGIAPKPLTLPPTVSAAASPQSGMMPMTPAPGFDGEPKPMTPPGMSLGGPMPMTQAPPTATGPRPQRPRMGGAGANIPFYGRQ